MTDKRWMYVHIAVAAFVLGTNLLPPYPWWMLTIAAVAVIVNLYAAYIRWEFSKS